MNELKPEEMVNELDFIKNEIKSSTVRSVARILFSILSIFLMSVLISKSRMFFEVSEQKMYLVLCAGVMAVSVIDVVRNILRIPANRFFLKGIEEMEKGNLE